MDGQVPQALFPIKRYHMIGEGWGGVSAAATNPRMITNTGACRQVVHNSRMTYWRPETVVWETVEPAMEAPVAA